MFNQIMSTPEFGVTGGGGSVGLDVLTGVDGVLLDWSFSLGAPPRRVYLSKKKDLLKRLVKKIFSFY